MRPLPGLEGHGATRGGERFSRASGADKEKRQRCMRLGEVSLEFDRAPDMIDRSRKERGIGLTACPGHLVLPETRVRQADVCECIPRIQDDGALEISNCAGNQRSIERFEPHATFGERLIRLEAAGLPIRPPCRRRLLEISAERLAELLDDAILQLEDLLELAIGLGFGKRFTGTRVHHACGDAESIRGSLEAPDHREVQMQVLAQVREVRSHTPHRLDHANAIDDAMSSRGAEIVRDSFSNPRGQPRKLLVGADV